MKTVKARVTDSFSADDRDRVQQYLDWLRSALTDQSASLRRTVTLLIVIMAAFEFIIQSPHSSFQLAGFRINRGSIVLQFLPAITAYLYLQIFIDAVSYFDMKNAFIAAFSRWSPEAAENEIHVFLKPSSPVYWRMG